MVGGKLYSRGYRSGGVSVCEVCIRYEMEGCDGLGIIQAEK
jgi:hypothetical protein